MENTVYRIMCRKITAPGEWQIKTVCKEKWQAEKFIGVLETASDVYLELKIEPVYIPVPNKKKGA